MSKGLKQAIVSFLLLNSDNSETANPRASLNKAPCNQKSKLTGSVINNLQSRIKIRKMRKMRNI